VDRFVEWAGDWNEGRFLMKIITRIRWAAVILLNGPWLGASDWNQWRGAQRDGIAAGFKAPSVWAADAWSARWSVTVGEGHASPVVAGDRLFLFAREKDHELMRCLELATGKVVWEEGYPVPYEMNSAARGHGKGPKSTPAVVGGRIFALGIDGHLSSWDAKSGAVLWRKSFAGEFKETSPAFGASVSPIVDGENVIVHVGGRDQGALIAFDAATGKVNWRWSGDGPAYTSPIVATIGGVRQLITQSQKRCLAVAPADGRLLWEIPFTTPYEQNIVTPVVLGDLVIFSGLRNPMFAVRVTGDAATKVWENREIGQYMSSPVLDGTKLYGMSDKRRGTLFTLDALSGTVLWKDDGLLGANATLTDIGPALLVLTDSGDLTVQEKAGDALKEVARYKVADAPIWASLAVAGDRVIVKGKTTVALYAFSALQE